MPLLWTMDIYNKSCLPLTLQAELWRPPQIQEVVDFQILHNRFVSTNPHNRSVFATILQGVFVYVLNDQNEKKELQPTWNTFSNSKIHNSSLFWHWESGGADKKTALCNTLSQDASLFPIWEDPDERENVPLFSDMEVWFCVDQRQWIQWSYVWWRRCKHNLTASYIKFHSARFLFNLYFWIQMIFVVLRGFRGRLGWLRLCPTWLGQQGALVHDAEQDAR